MTFTDEDLKRWKNDVIPNSEAARLIARLEAAEKIWPLLEDIEYCLTNIWALDRKKFEAEFLPRIKEGLEAWRKAAGRD